MDSVFCVFYRGDAGEGYGGYPEELLTIHLTKSDAEEYILLRCNTIEFQYNLYKTLPEFGNRSDPKCVAFEQANPLWLEDSNLNNYVIREWPIGK